MKIFSTIHQICSDYNRGFFNIKNFDGIAIGISGVPSETFLFKIENSKYGDYFIASTSNIEGFLDYINSSDLYKNYKLIGNIKDIKG